MSIETVVTTKFSRARRARRSPAASRAVILASAQAILIQRGSLAVTLKAVAETAGMSHGNVTHHFGTSPLLQAALVDHVALQMTEQLLGLRTDLQTGRLTRAGLVAAVFNAMSTTCFAYLVGSSSFYGEPERLRPIYGALEACIRHLYPAAQTDHPTPQEIVTPTALNLFSFALTASLIGGRAEGAMNTNEIVLRDLAARVLRE
jgi:AcrR family transcriptional regulator